MKLEVLDSIGTGTCTGNIDPDMYLIEADCSTSVTSNFDSGPDACPLIDPASSLNAAARNLAPGTYFAKVKAYSSSFSSAPATFAYEFVLTVTGVCGNNVVEPGEVCDGSAGCDASCKLPVVCGNGAKQGSEACDDGNVIDGDGCSANCTVEQGYVCTGTNPSTCSTPCGNGVLDYARGESCDDGNRLPNDGCSDKCQLEAIGETEPNETYSAANVLTPNGSFWTVRGDHSVATDVDVFSITVAAGRTLIIEVVEGDTSETCESLGIDSYLRLLDANGNPVKDTFGSDMEDDDGGRGFCSKLDTTGVTLAGGTYYVEVKGSTASSASTAGKQFQYGLVVEAK